jgi:ABC-type phosphate transport system substrate-binding protein
MKTHRAVRAGFLAAGLSLFLFAPSPAAAEELVVIVNAANPVGPLTAQEVKGYFLKKNPVWRNGEKVRPADRKAEGPDRAAFLSKVLGMSSDELERYWLERQYANADHPPAGLDDDPSVVKFVSFFKGGMGFVTRSALSKAGAEGVKPVLTIAF